MFKSNIYVNVSSFVHDCPGRIDWFYLDYRMNYRPGYEELKQIATQFDRNDSALFGNIFVSKSFDLLIDDNFSSFRNGFFVDR
jgi:hypothetical protein